MTYQPPEPTEIEITPEMIEAGADEVFEATQFLDGEHLDQDEMRALARKAFIRMWEVGFGKFPQLVG